MSPLDPKQFYLRFLTELTQMDAALLTTSNTLSRFTLSSSALINFVELGLNYDLSGLRRGLSAIIRNERAASPTELIEPDPLAVLAFSTACAPALVNSWIEALLSRVRVFEDETGDTFSFDDHQYRVRITVRDNVVEEVSPLPNRTASGW